MYVKEFIMQYAITFLEGVITFISPCLLPMLPIYISYFAGGDADADIQKTLRGAIGFITGFSLVFIALGAFAGGVGGLLQKYQIVVNILTGAVVILFGLNFIGALNIKFINNTYGLRKIQRTNGFFSSAIFGIVFSIGWTPCVGAFLGSALMLASRQGSTLQGVLLLLCYSVGLGIPFLISAVLISQLKSTFDAVKKHYNMINFASGLFLIIIGILMMTGLMGRFWAILTF